MPALVAPADIIVVPAEPGVTSKIDLREFFGIDGVPVTLTRDGAGNITSADATRQLMRIDTNYGRMNFELYTDLAPQTANRFITYSQTEFHYSTATLPEFVTQWQVDEIKKPYHRAWIYRSAPPESFYDNAPDAWTEAQANSATISRTIQQEAGEPRVQGTVQINSGNNDLYFEAVAEGEGDLRIFVFDNGGISGDNATLSFDTNSASPLLFVEVNSRTTTANTLISEMQNSNGGGMDGFRSRYLFSLSSEFETNDGTGTIPLIEYAGDNAFLEVGLVSVFGRSGTLPSGTEWFWEPNPMDVLGTLPNENTTSGLSNVRGTIAMYRKDKTNFANERLSRGWIINTGDNGADFDNDSTNTFNPNARVVFGRAIGSSMDVADDINIRLFYDSRGNNPALPFKFTPLGNGYPIAGGDTVRFQHLSIVEDVLPVDLFTGGPTGRNVLSFTPADISINGSVAATAALNANGYEVDLGGLDLGAHTLHVRVEDDHGNFAEADLPLFVVPANFTAWRNYLFSGGEESDDNISGAPADIDADSINNFGEFIFNLDPRAYDAPVITPGIRSDGADQYFNLTFSRLRNGLALQHDVQLFDDAQLLWESLQPADFTIMPSVPEGVTERVTIEINEPINGIQIEQVRLRLNE